MDIRHPIDARAAVTLGKDMTLRDFAQGCWRMRGLARGQTAHVIIVKEVQKMIEKASAGKSSKAISGVKPEDSDLIELDDEPQSTAPQTSLSSFSLKSASAPSGGIPTPTLQEIIGWLLLNTLQSEQLQHLQLAQQNIEHVWRKRAFKTLLKASYLRTFCEKIRLKFHGKNLRLEKKTIRF